MKSILKKELLVYLESNTVPGGNKTIVYGLNHIKIGFTRDNNKSFFLNTTFGQAVSATFENVYNKENRFKI